MIIGVLIVNKSGWNLLKSWQVEYNTIVIDYLKVFFAWPTIVLIIITTFFIKFNSAIDYFIRNLKVKYKGVEASSQQAKNLLPDETQTTEEKEERGVQLSKQDAQVIIKKIDDLETKITSKQKQLETLRGLSLKLFERAEFFEFKYLNSILVLNTKAVLRDLYNKNEPMTRELFIRSIIVPATVIDKLSEQLAIHNALLVNGLIEEKDSILIVTEKGVRYLKFAGFI